MSNKPSLVAGRPSDRLSQEDAKPVDKDNGIDRINVHFTTKNARKLRLYAAANGMRGPSEALNKLVEALEFDVKLD
ncbi:hypothetical protein EGJ51_17705 [Pseudomonas fulva]|uniref:hypothetical protein n=1 Tax=Pseudomonas fulva TaxID=47880 RepID=UPI000F784797|nr:hypothetical protein [Pseudomonas fulva]RRW59474.1 hypothetical protein EGJ51_17705 [Pseudomonas fulva]